MLSISSNGEARVVLTDQCNYRCIFCHNEGVEEAVVAAEPDDSRLRKALNELIENGCRDITFTGGEPLIRRDLLLIMIRHIRTRDKELPVTIVTNGSLLTPDFIQTVAKISGVRFNVSFHAADNSGYRRLTGQARFSLDALRDHLRHLHDAEIPFKLNGVALRSTMPDKKSIADLIQFAQQSGAVSLKIIELLMVEQNQSLLSEHLSLESVEKRLPADFEMRSSVPRGKVFCHRQSGFAVELRKCRCHFGCEECLRTQQTASLDSSGRYWACFARPDRVVALADIGFEQTVSQGDALLEAMRQRHGTGSPSLSRQAELVPEKKHAWFLLPAGFDIRSILNGAALEQLRQYSGIFFEPAFRADGFDLPAVHIRCNLNNPENAMLIISRLTLEKQGALIIHNTRYFDSDKVPIKADAAYLERFLNALGWRRTIEAQAEEKEYRIGGVALSCIEFAGVHRAVSVDVRSPEGLCLAESLAALPGVQAVGVTVPRFLENLFAVQAEQPV